MANPSLDVSIVLAAYNEESSIMKELDDIKNIMSKSRFTHEIIVVDDASRDNTPKILENTKGIRLITHNMNRGSGGARKTGTLVARGNIVVWTDVDMSYPNNLIPQLVERLRNSTFRQIVGNRLTEKGSAKILRIPAKYFLKLIASFLTKTDIPDLNSGFRAFYRKDSIKFMHMVPDGFSCVSTMTLAFLCNGLDVGYMPIEYKKRVGRSKFHPIKDSYNYFLQILRMITYFKPLRIFLPVAMVVFFFTLFKNIIDLIMTKDTQETDIIGYFMAFIIFAVGMLADLIVVHDKKPLSSGEM
jgi:glycosyltransferase involved in cell wall biosynthesis